MNLHKKLLFTSYCILALTALTGCQKLESTDPYNNSSTTNGLKEGYGSISIEIRGLTTGKQTLMTIQNDEGAVVLTQKFFGSGSFVVDKPLPEGHYLITTEAPGTGFHAAKAQQMVQVQSGTMTGTTAEFEVIKNDSFHYHWESDLKGRDYEYSSETGFKHTVEFLGQDTNYSFSSAAEVLLQKYNIILSNDGDTSWTSLYATGLLRTIKSIPHHTISKTKFIITKEELIDDISIKKMQQGAIVTLAQSAFNYAEPKMVKLDGKVGHFFSRRLFHSLIHFYTNYGKNERSVRKILDDKFALTTDIQRSKLTKLTGEHWDHYQTFKPNELVEVIMALAEMPEGYYKIPGLRYLLRRRDGQPHPVLKEAVAVASPRGPHVNSYIEFMETAFTNGRTRDAVHKTVLHEKAHFLWGNIFSDDIKNEWIRIGGWYKNSNDPSGWSTTSTTHFVTPYAHLLDPNEDMAESLSFYIRNPKKLQSVASEKYMFIEKYIMNGYKYLTQVRSDLQFEVLNLFPDYDYPGKIQRVDVYANGTGHEDKEVIIEIELQKIEGYQTSAQSAYMRLLSSIDTFVDLRLYPINGRRNGHVLRGRFSMPKNAKNGYWITQQIVVTDQVGNERFEDLDDYGFKLFINNAKEDKVAPLYIRDSMKLSTKTIQKEGRDVFEITANWSIDEDIKMDDGGAYASLSFQGADRVYSLRSWGSVNTQTNIATVKFQINEYFPTGLYGISYIKMVDRSLNSKGEYFSKDPKDENITTIHIAPLNRDNTPPELDVNQIVISAVPVNPESPNGETVVNLSIRVKDDLSGTGHISFKLEDPTGKTHHFYFYHSNFNTLFFKGGSPTEWSHLNIAVTLPEGSAPGTWGLREVYMEDKGGNFKTYSFVEVIHFQLDSEKDKT